MGKIVAILASPRSKGNSNAIVDSILDGAMGLSTNVIKLHRLDNLRSTHGCKACMYCKKNDRCVQQDDITPVLEDISTADCVIFSTPVYFNGPNAQYKILEDRMYSFCKADGGSNLPSGKNAIIVVTSGAPSEAVAPIADNMANVLKRMGFNIIRTVLFSDEGGKKSATVDQELMDDMKNLGLNFRNT